MKKCPSCNSNVHEDATVCSTCGYKFGAEPRNKTVMGLPAVTSFDQSPPEAPEAANKGTLFGFPAQKAAQAPQPADLEEDSYDDYDDDGDATHLIPASQLQAEYEDPSGSAAHVEEHDSTRTYAGLPAVEAIGSAWGLGDAESEEEPENDGQSTSVVPASKLFDMAGGDQGNGPQGAGFSRTTGEDRFSTHGTLMGMSLDEIEGPPKSDAPEQPMRSTQFGVPAVQASDLHRSTDFDTPLPSSDPKDTTIPDLDSTGPVIQETPTQAWAPTDDIASLFDQTDHRDELRDLREQKAEERHAGTRMGLPAVNRTTAENPVPMGGQRQSGERAGVAPTPQQPAAPSAPADESKSRLPDAATLRARLKAKREALKTNRTAVDPETIPPPNLENEATGGKYDQPAGSGVLGGGAYMMGSGAKRKPKKKETNAPVAPSAPTPPPVEDADDDNKRAPLARIETQKRSTGVTPVDIHGNPIVLESSMETLGSPPTDAEDLAFAETNVAPRDLLSRIRSSTESDGSPKTEAAAPAQAQFDVDSVDFQPTNQLPRPENASLPQGAPAEQGAESPRFGAQPPKPAMPAPQPEQQQPQAPQQQHHFEQPQQPAQPQQQPFEPQQPHQPQEQQVFDAQRAPQHTPGGFQPTPTPAPTAPALEEQPTAPFGEGAPAAQAPTPYDSAMNPAAAPATAFPTAASPTQAPQQAPAPQAQGAGPEGGSGAVPTIVGALAGFVLLVSAAAGWVLADEPALEQPIFAALSGIAIILGGVLPLPRKIKGVIMGLFGLMAAGLLVALFATGKSGPIVAMIIGVVGAILGLVAAALSFKGSSQG